MVGGKEAILARMVSGAQSSSKPGCQNLKDNLATNCEEEREHCSQKLHGKRHQCIRTRPPHKEETPRAEGDDLSRGGGGKEK